MPQELQVLRCFGCETYQVHIVKNVPKWICKICMEKQSIKKVYFSGSGKDCRQIVQNLNKQQIENHRHNVQFLQENPEIIKENCNTVSEEPKESKWELFLPKSEKIVEEDEDGIFCFEKPKKGRKRKIKDHTMFEKGSKLTRNSGEEEIEATLVSSTNQASSSSSKKWDLFLGDDKEVGGDRNEEGKEIRREAESKREEMEEVVEDISPMGAENIEGHTKSCEFSKPRKSNIFETNDEIDEFLDI